MMSSVRCRVKQMKRYALITVTLVVLGANTLGGGQVYRSRSNPPTDGLVGANYTPAYAVNQVQFWHDFRPKVVEKELAAAQKYFGIKTLRVYLHNMNFNDEKDVFLANLE